MTRYVEASDSLVDAQRQLREALEELENVRKELQSAVAEVHEARRALSEASVELQEERVKYKDSEDYSSELEKVLKANNIELPKRVHLGGKR